MNIQSYVDMLIIILDVKRLPSKRYRYDGYHYCKQCAPPKAMEVIQMIWCLPRCKKCQKLLQFEPPIYSNWWDEIFGELMEIKLLSEKKYISMILAKACLVHIGLYHGDAIYAIFRLKKLSKYVFDNFAKEFPSELII